MTSTSCATNVDGFHGHVTVDSCSATVGPVTPRVSPTSEWESGPRAPRSYPVCVRSPEPRLLPRYPGRGALLAWPRRRSKVTDGRVGEGGDGAEGARQTTMTDAELLRAAATPLTRGAAFGRYLVLSCVGEGGMGVVYAAYDPDLDRRVAVKLLRLDAEREEARLLREARAIARLQHPNVIAVHDVGLFEGRVFVAMELVEGTTVAQWLDARPRDWRAIVDVFVQAGRGLAAAHAVGLVHRDFKPANVLLGRDGRARVVDFGLARSADSSREFVDGGGDATATAGSLETLTRQGALVGTPAYMSPEQLAGGAAVPQSDQFSFCVALYRALYAQRPFGGEDMAAIRIEVEAGRLRPPPKDSRVPTWIRDAVLRGLATDPARRWPEMDDLLAALARDPVKARRRRIAAVAVVIAVVAVALGYRALRRHDSLVCRDAERRLVGVWNDARRSAVHAAFAATGKRYAEDVFHTVAKALDRYTQAWVFERTDACEATRIRGEQSELLLDLRMECLDHRRDQLSAVVDVLTHADDTVVQRAVQAMPTPNEIAECHDTEALRAVVRPPPDADARVRVEQGRTVVNEATALRHAGKYRDAIAKATAAVERARALGYAPLEGEALYELGLAEEYTGALQKAEKTFADAIAATERGRNDVVRAKCLVSLAAMVGDDLARYDDAERLLSIAQGVVTRVGGDDVLRAQMLEADALIAADRGNAAAAIPIWREVLALRERALGAEDGKTAVAHIDLGESLRGTGQYGDAMKEYQRALAILQSAYGPWHPLVAFCWNDMGAAMNDLGDSAAALPYFRRALEIREASLGPTHPDVAKTLSNIGIILTEIGEEERALPLIERALVLKQKIFGLDHPSVARTLLARANLELHRGRFVDALPWAERSLAIREKREAGTRYLAESLWLMAAVRLGLRQPAHALPLAERSVTILEKQKDVLNLAVARFVLARALAANHRDPQRARQLATQARETLARDCGPDGRRRLPEIDAWLRQHG